MRRPAVFFDRDNTLIIGTEYLGDPAGVKLVAGAAGAVATCRNLGYAVITVSNQSGVARGMFTEADVQAVDAEMDRQLLEHNSAAVIDRHEYCPHHPEGTVDDYRRRCECRKPKPGMIFTAAEAMALDIKKSWMVGDAPRDVAAGKAAGCRTILIIDKTLAASPAASEDNGIQADFTVGSLIEAAEVIAQAAARPAPPVMVVAPKPPPSAAPTETPAQQSVPAAPVPSIAPRPRPTSPTGDAPTPAAAPSAATPPRPAAAQPSATPAAAPAPAPMKRPAAAPPVAEAQKVDLARLEMSAQQILMELKKLNDAKHDDFSISKLVAGITQTLALAALPVAYVLYRNDPNTFQAWLLASIYLEAFTIAMLIMGRQR